MSDQDAVLDLPPFEKGGRKLSFAYGAIGLRGGGRRLTFLGVNAADAAVVAVFTGKAAVFGKRGGGDFTGAEFSRHLDDKGVNVLGELGELLKGGNAGTCVGFPVGFEGDRDKDALPLALHGADDRWVRQHKAVHLEALAAQFFHCFGVGVPARFYYRVDCREIEHACREGGAIAGGAVLPDGEQV